jgi:hypothetical protein
MNRLNSECLAPTETMMSSAVCFVPCARVELLGDGRAQRRRAGDGGVFGDAALLDGGDAPRP